MNYRVCFKDCDSKTFAMCSCEYISVAIDIYNSTSACEKYIIDSNTDEVLVFDNGSMFINALEIISNTLKIKR